MLHYSHVYIAFYLSGLKFLAFADKTSPWRKKRILVSMWGSSVPLGHVNGKFSPTLGQWYEPSFSIHNNCACVSFPWGGLFQYWLWMESRAQNRQGALSVLRFLGTFRDMKFQTGFFSKANMRLVLTSFLGLAWWRFRPLFWRESRVFVKWVAAIQSVNFKDGFLALVAWK